ncbi:hypothetical protein MW402_00465 (plasmid) [Escherichia coli]|uniref:hypothetical protein n=1 Tax=Escherichia coli TaxID=562 RepID=UPI00227F6604|nr:hypothetical protein [Escherichia coli]WAH30252.1 hypothetical protein MW402_00465 [Escherichia coli]
MRISNIGMAEETDRISSGSSENRPHDRDKIIDLIDNEAGLTEQERKLLHVLVNSGKKRLTGTGERTKTGVQKRSEGKKQRRERNHRLFLAAWATVEAGLVRHKNRRACYKKDRIYKH